MFEPVVLGLARLGIVFVNVYALGEPGHPWVLVDAGLRGSGAISAAQLNGASGPGRGRRRSC